MMYYLVAVMSVIHFDMSRDVYIFDYDFASLDHCQYYHAVNEVKIDDFLLKTYNHSQDIHQIFCIDAESLTDWVENNASEAREGITS